MCKRSTALEQQFRYCRFFPMHSMFIIKHKIRIQLSQVTHTIINSQGKGIKQKNHRLANKLQPTEITATLTVIDEYLYWQLHLNLGTTKKENKHTWEVILSKLLWKKFSFFHCQELLRICYQRPPVAVWDGHKPNCLYLKGKPVFTRAWSMPFTMTVPSMVWEEDLDSMESTQSRKSAILLCLTSGRTINLSQKKNKIAAIDFMTPSEKKIFPPIQTGCSSWKQFFKVCFPKSHRVRTLQTILCLAQRLLSKALI